MGTSADRAGLHLQGPEAAVAVPRMQYTDLETLTAVIARSQIVVAPAASPTVARRIR